MDGPAADSQDGPVMTSGGHVKLLSWKRSPDNRVLAYPSAIGTIIEIEEHATITKYLLATSPLPFISKYISVFDGEELGYLE